MLRTIFLIALGLADPVLPEGVTTTAHLNVRTGPGLSFGKVWVAKPGTSFPILGRQGQWIKIQILQYRPGAGTGFYVDTAAKEAEKGDTLEVSIRNARGEKVSEEFLPKAVLQLAEKRSNMPKLNGFLRVNIMREGWVFAGYTRGAVSMAAREGRGVKEAFRLPAPPALPLHINWAKVKTGSPLFLPLPSLREIGKLDSGAIVQILGEEKTYLKIQVSSADLKDTLFIDLNQFYDTNAGDTATLVLGGRDSIQSLGPIRKDQLRFDANRAFFGPGISRLVPVELDLPLLLNSDAVEHFQTFQELSVALKDRRESHPNYFFPAPAVATLTKLTREDLESVITPKWFIEGGKDRFAFGLTLKTVAVRAAGRNPEEYLFQKYVRQVLDAYRASLSSLKEFNDLIVDIEYMEPGIGGSALKFKTLSFRFPITSLADLDQGKATYQDLFRLALVQHLGGST